MKMIQALQADGVHIVFSTKLTGLNISNELRNGSLFPKKYLEIKASKKGQTFLLMKILVYSSTVTAISSVLVRLGVTDVFPIMNFLNSFALDPK